jgi:hypothetical protein
VWEDVDLVGVQGGYQALRSILTCALREAHALDRILVVPAQIPDSSGERISIHEVFDMQEADAYLKLTMDNTAEWRSVLSRANQVVLEDDPEFWFKTRDLAGRNFKHEPLLIRRFRQQTLELDTEGKEIRGSFRPHCMDLGTEGIVVENRIFTLSLSSKVFRLLDSFRSRVKYYDAVKIDSYVEHKSRSNASRVDWVRAVASGVKPNIVNGRTVFLSVKDGVVRRAALTALQDSYNVVFVEEILPISHTSQMVVNMLSDLVYKKAYARIEIRISDVNIINASTLVTTGPTLAPALYRRESASGGICYYNPLFVIRSWMVEKGYGAQFRRELLKDLRECPTEKGVITTEQFLEDLAIYILTLPGQVRLASAQLGLY